MTDRMRTEGSAILATPIGNASGRFYQIVGTNCSHFPNSAVTSPADAIRLVESEIAGLAGVVDVEIKTFLVGSYWLGGATPTIASVEVHFSGISTETVDATVQSALRSYTDLTELPIMAVNQPIVHHVRISSLA